MERHDSMKRAARYLLGAGTFAAAMVAMTAGTASAQTSTCLMADEAGVYTVCGHVFTDANNDNAYTQGEGEAGTGVILKADGSNQVVSNPTESGACEDPENCGYYSFTLYEPGAYWVCLADLQTLTCTGNPVKVTVVDGTQTKPVDFMIGSGEQELPVDQEPPYDIGGPGTGTPGYWKNHRDAWPAEGVMVGNVQYYNTVPPPPAGAKTILDAMKLMGKVSGDKSYSMFSALISAKLNALLGNNYLCVQGTLAAADTWMIANPVGSGVKGSSAAWEAGEPLHSKLDDYNNGKLCAPHRN